MSTLFRKTTIARHLDLAGQQDVLAGLRHRAVGGAHHQDRPVHLGRAGDHVLDVVGMARTVDVGVVALVGLVLDVGDRDRDAPLALLRRVVDRVEAAEGGLPLQRQRLRDRRRQTGLAMIDMANRAHIDVRLGPLKLRLAHALGDLLSDRAKCVVRMFAGWSGFDWRKERLRVGALRTKTWSPQSDLNR